MIRDALGIHKRRELSEEERERLWAFAFERGQRSEAGSSAPAAADAIREEDLA